MQMNRAVFLPSAALIALFVLLGATSPGTVAAAFAALQDAIVTHFGWFYILSVGFFVVFVVWILFSRFGSIRLGRDDETPEYGRLTWFSMLFSAGMGIGLLFYGVAEPVTHFANPVRGTPESVEAAREAITITYFHWGLHAWSIYIVVGLSLAYFAYRHDLPLTLRSTLYPLLGARIHGPLGNLVDVIAVFGTLFGLATSLGLGVMQINAGLDYMGMLEVSTPNQVVLILAITLVATISVVTGVDVGIRRLSELNLVAAVALLGFVFAAGPTLFLLSSFVESLGRYGSSLVQMTFRTDAFIGLEWQKSWTMFYWGWWISWSPFVGMFIARVSRGRTIREFVAGVLLVPTLLTFFWMSVFGGTAIHTELFGAGGMVSAVDEDISTAIFAMLGSLPLSMVTWPLATLVVAVFFVTSSDSGSLVIDILTSGGHPDPPIAQRVFWALTEGAVAAILLVTGGLVALQTAALTTALPVCALLLAVCWSLARGLSAERSTRDPITDLLETIRQVPASARRLVGVPPPAALASARRRLEAPAPKAGDDRWRQRLRRIVETRDAQRARALEKAQRERSVLTTFLQDTVLPVFDELAHELETTGRIVTVDHDERQATLTVWEGGREEFSYGVRGMERDKRRFAFPEFPRRQADGATRAEIVLRSGRRAEYDVRQLSAERLRGDFLDAYAKWMGW